MKSVRIFLICVSVFLAVIAVNHFRLNTYAKEAMQFRDVSALAYYRYGVAPNAIVLDIWAAEGGSSAAGTIGGLVEFAEALADRSFETVVLAYRGRARFILDGDDFRRIGCEAGWQNPVYTIRTLPEKLRRPDGRRAYSTWSGGIIGALSAQMDDVNSFAQDWYLREELRR
jgi:hypothetical protein